MQSQKYVSIEGGLPPGANLAVLRPGIPGAVSGVRHHPPAAHRCRGAAGHAGLSGGVHPAGGGADPITEIDPERTADELAVQAQKAIDGKGLLP